MNLAMMPNVATPYNSVRWRELWRSMSWQRPGGKKKCLSQDYHAYFGIL